MKTVAISDYLNNIKTWLRGNFQSIAFYKKINAECFTDYSTMKIPSITDARFGQCFIGDVGDKGARVTNILAIENYIRPKTTYNGNVGMGALSPQSLNLTPQNSAFAYDRLVKNELQRDPNTKIAVYVELDTADKLINSTQGLAGCIGAAGSCYNLVGLGNMLVYYMSAASPWAKCNFDETTHTPTTYINSAPAYANQYYIKDIKYFAEINGVRTEVRNAVPVFPFTATNTFSAKRIINMESTSLEGFNASTTSYPPRMLVPCNGVGNFTLPMLQAATGGLKPNVVSTSGGAVNQAQSGNWAEVAGFDDSMYIGILAWLMPTVNLTQCSFAYNSNNRTVLKQGKELLIPPFNINYVKRFLLTNNNSASSRYALVTDTGQYYAPADGDVIPLFASIDTVKKLFADWGIYASDNLDEIQSGIIPDIIPDNPASPSDSPNDSGIDPDLPDGFVTENPLPPSPIPQDPQNKIDDFPITPPSITPAVLCNSYIYNLSEIRLLFNWLCSKSYWQNQTELFADKLSAIYGLMIFPFDLVGHDSAHCTATSTTTIVSVSDEIPGYVLENGYNTIINGGELTYLSFYGNFADWNRCTYTIYVPYGGVVSVAASAVVNRRLTIQYAVDLLTGKATAIIKSYSLNSTTLGVLVKLVPCQLGHLVPVQSSNYAQREMSNTLEAIGMASSVVNGIVSGVTGGGVSVLTNGLGIAQQAVSNKFNDQLSYGATGGLSPATGLSLAQTPFLSISRNHLVNPANFRKMNGLPTAYETPLNNVSNGSNFVQCSNAYIDIPRATDGEISEISALLSSGVYI